MSFGRAGTPLTTNDIRLENWEEGGYLVTNKPYPQGEIIIGGGNVAQGYYKMPDTTAESFFEEGGKRWFKTGDVGEFHGDGVLKIIDRKKDLVKLQSGEYISLGKVEAILKISPLVENACIHCDPMKSFCTVLIAPAEKGLSDLAKTMNIGGDFTELCGKKILQTSVLNSLTDHARKAGLTKFEIPQNVFLCKELWTPESGLVTAAFKIKRKEILNFYAENVQAMYKL